jgi:hypothetical protein
MAAIYEFFLLSLYLSLSHFATEIMTGLLHSFSIILIANCLEWQLVPINSLFPVTKRNAI